MSRKRKVSTLASRRPYGHHHRSASRGDRAAEVVGLARGVRGGVRRAPVGQRAPRVHERLREVAEAEQEGDHHAGRTQRPEERLCVEAQGRQALSERHRDREVRPRPGDDRASGSGGRDEEGEGKWQWIEYERSGSRYTVLAKGQLCVSCHMQAKSNDWVFTRLIRARTPPGVAATARSVSGTRATACQRSGECPPARTEIGRGRGCRTTPWDRLDRGRREHARRRRAARDEPPRPAPLVVDAGTRSLPLTAAGRRVSPPRRRRSSRASRRSSAPEPRLPRITRGPWPTTRSAPASTAACAKRTTSPRFSPR